MERLLNIKCNAKHATLEHQIKLLDKVQDISRAYILKQAVFHALPIQDWEPIYRSLSDLKPDEEVIPFSSWQCRYDTDTGESMLKVREQMYTSLRSHGIVNRVLQNQFLLQMLLMNYLEVLQKKQIEVKAAEDRTHISENITIPEMAALFTEMILTDKDADDLAEIRKILVNWRNSR